jgi:predicted nucleotidyltransferase
MPVNSETLRHAIWSNNKYISLIVEKLKIVRPYKIILFGSYAYGEPNVNSDIDLLIVLDKNGITKTYKEKYQKRMVVGQQLLEIEREVPVDTLVYTRDEWKLFLNQDSSFSRLINRKGIVLYETSNPRMAQPS